MISIHTSAREVTVPYNGYVAELHISIHTSAREVTKKSDIEGCYDVFQSTLPQGK